MYRNTRSRVRVDGAFSDDFLVQAGLSPLLFIIVLDTPSGKIRSECPEELLYDDDLALVSETLESLKGRLEAWKGALESKRLKANVNMTKKDD